MSDPQLSENVYRQKCGCLLRSPYLHEYETMRYTKYNWVVSLHCSIDHLHRVGHGVSDGDVENDRYAQWLAGLQAGDQVLVSAGGWGGVKTLTTVAKVTATQIRIGKDTYRRKDGWRTGDRYRAKIHPVTPVDLEAIEKDKIIDRLKHQKWQDVGLPVLRAIHGLLEEP